MAIVPVGADGNIHLYNASGDTHLIVDVLGYLESGRPADSTTGRVVPLDAPFRVFDTRQPEFGSTPLGFGTSESWSFADFANSVNLGGVPIGAQSALLGNLTGTGLARTYPTVPVTTYMTMYPGGVQPARELEHQRRRGPDGAEHVAARVRHRGRRHERDQRVQLRRLAALPARRLRRRAAL